MTTVMKNKKEIIDNIVLQTLHQHNKDVLHGSQNLARQLPKHRKPNDWDIYSYSERKRAYQLEKKIDNRFGKDIAKVHNDKWYDKNKKIRLYQVDTPIKGGDIDLINRPTGIHTIRKQGITLLSLKDEMMHKKKASKEYGRKTKSKQDMAYIRSFIGRKTKRKKRRY